MPTTLAETLKHATSDAHRHAESRDLQRLLIRGALDDRLLAEYLAQLRSVHAELERLLDLHTNIARLIDWADAFRHSRRLDGDLAALGIAASDNQANAATARLLDTIQSSASREPASLLGFFYVLEGSMNGNRFIVRALRQSPAAARCAFAYFDPYGDPQPQRWAAFKFALERAGDALNLDQQREVVDAALALFERNRPDQ
jgi:heme oxygenase